METAPQFVSDLHSAGIIVAKVSPKTDGDSKTIDIRLNFPE